MYTKYVTDLLNTSHLMQDSVEYRRKRTGEHRCSIMTEYSRAGVGDLLDSEGQTTMAVFG